MAKKTKKNVREWYRVNPTNGTITAVEVTGGPDPLVREGRLYRLARTVKSLYHSKAAAIRALQPKKMWACDRSYNVFQVLVSPDGGTTRLSGKGIIESLRAKEETRAKLLARMRKEVRSSINRAMRQCRMYDRELKRTQSLLARLK